MSLFAALELWLTLLLLLAVVVSAKLARFPADPRLSVEDLALASLASAPLVLAEAALPAGARTVVIALGALALVLLFMALWLDALLFRIFTVELGTGGIGTVVWSALYRELAELEQARRFVRDHPAFALFGPIAALGIARVLFTSPVLHDALSAAFAAGTAWILLSGVVAKTRGTWILWIASTLAALARSLSSRHVISSLGDLEHQLLVAIAAALVVAEIARWVLGRPGGDDFLFAPAQLLRAFGRGRMPPLRAPHEPRPEHRAWLSAGPTVPLATPLHGRLRGRNVIFVTLESVGRDHLAQWGGAAQAKTPFLDALAHRSVVSANHFCICPNTNEAHTALYASNYAGQSGFAPMRALVDAGYEAIYLTAADTRDYGLDDLLTRAGFSKIIDRADLEPDPRDGGVPSDWAMATSGVARLAEDLAPRSQERPFFLHVHTANTHVPYRVVDRARFGRRDASDDRGRFLDGVEEADAILGALFAALRSRGLDDDALVVVSSDHGQAFGERGYLSHASAVIAPELTVPFFLAHPAIEPREVHRSSHFDVLPTVLDLLGVALAEPTFGRSIFSTEPEPESLLVWAGHPSRSRSSNFGLLTPDRKYMVDLVSGRAHELTWDDLPVRELAGAEKVYWMQLLHHILVRRGLT